MILCVCVLNLGPALAEGDEETAVPALISEASGVVLEIGPGIGSQLPRYDGSKITKVYGVEPNIDLHKSLREKVKASGLTDVYEIAACGIEDGAELEKHGIGRDSIDTVISIQVLCSVLDPDEMLRRLYALMKPGGQLIVYEHVKNRDVLSGIVQGMFDFFHSVIPSRSCAVLRWNRHTANLDPIDLYNIFWPFFIGNCHLNRNIHHSIMQAGDWAKIDLTSPTSEDATRIFPRIYGRLWKK